MDNEDNDDLLFTNAFISPLSTKDLLPDQKAQFRDYYTRVTQQQHRAERLRTIQDAQGQSGNSSASTPAGSAVSSSNTNGSGTYAYSKTSIVNIDTRDRNVNLYPNQNHFKAFLGHHFQNIQQIRLISTEFPNTDQVIRGPTSSTQNNLISWSNLEDTGRNLYQTGVTLTNGYLYLTIPPFYGVALGLTVGSTLIIFISGANANNEGLYGFHSVTVYSVSGDTTVLRFPWGTSPLQSPIYVDLEFPSYTVSLTPGNYTEDTLATELQTAMNLVKRQQGTGPYHHFIVTANTDTDIMTFQSFILTSLNPNPLGTTQWSSVITVTQAYHGFSVGDSVLITGVTSNVAGISYASLNGVFIVSTVPDINTFTFTLVAIVAVSTTTGGGITVQTGRATPFRLLFNTFGETLASAIGFPEEDSSVLLNTSNASGPITTTTYAVSNAIMGNNFITITTTTNHILTSSTKSGISSVVSGTLEGTTGAYITTSTDHGITQPTSVYILGSNSIPSVDGNWSAIPTDHNLIFISGLTITTSGTAAGNLRWGGDIVNIVGLRTLPPLTGYTSFPIDNASGDSFDIPIPVTYIDPNSISGSQVQTGLLTINHTSHGFNTITSIVSASYSPSLVPLPYVTTQLPHGITSSFVTVTLTDNYPAGYFTLTYPAPHNITYVQFLSVFIDSGLPSGALGVRAVNTVPNNYQITVVNTNAVGDGTCTVAQSSSPILVTQTNCLTSMDFWYQSVIVDSPTTFYIIPPQYYLGVSIPGTSGVIGRRRNDLALYRVVSDIPGGNTFAGIPLTSINGVYRDIVTIIDANNYRIRIPDQFATSSITGGGTGVHVSSEQHGMANLQANTVDGTATGTLYQTVNLSGENYVFLVCPGLNTVYGGQIVYNASGIADIFAKIMLAGPPGYVLFNTFVSEPSIFPFPIATLSELEFYVYKHDGSLFDFNGIDFSMAIEVTEVLSSHDSFNISSRSGTAFRAHGANTSSGPIASTPSKPLLLSGGPRSQLASPNLRGLGISQR